MKKLLFCAVSAVAICCHGGLFDSALKTVNKASEVVNTVDDARKSPAEAPQAAAPQAPVAEQPPQDTASVGVTDMPWDAAGYQARVAKVNEAMQKVAPKLPLRGEQDEWYNAAYGLTTADRQYGFLPPAQRVARVSEDNRVKIDKFISWVDGGMQADSAPATPVAAAPRATAGASSAAPSSAATAKPFDDNTARVLRIEWQQKIQAAREADEISLEASKQLNQEVCIASAQITSEAAAKQFATDMQAKLDAEKTAQANRIAAEKKVAEEKRIAAEKEAEARRLAKEREAEKARLAAEESRKAYEKGIEERKQQAKVAEAAAAQEQARQAQAEDLQKEEFTLRQKIETALIEFYGSRYREDHDVSKAAEDKVKEISENFKKDLKEHGFDEYNYSNKKYVTPEYIKWLKGAVAQCEGQLAKVKEEVDAETKKTVPVFKYLKDNCSRDEWISDKGSFTPEHKAELAKLLEGVSQQELAQYVRERNDMMLFVAAQLISDQKVLEDLLVTNTQWVKGGYRDGLIAWDFRTAYYNLYRNITDQDLLMKLWEQKEISFGTDGDSYGYKDPIVLKLLDKDHLAKLNRERIARRRAAQGKTIDVLGFYIGMPRKDFELLRFMRGLTDDEITGSFGTWKQGQADRFWMSKKFTAKHLNITGHITDLPKFTDRFVPGGEDAAGPVSANADVNTDRNYTTGEVDVSADTYWWRNCSKLAYPCKIKLYQAGSMVINADETDVKLDLSAADAMKDEDFDEAKLDRGGDASSGSGFPTFVVLLAAAIAALYFFRKKIDGFVATHPKYAKAWSLTCKAGNMASKIVTKIKGAKAEKTA